MSQTTITRVFEQWKAQQAVDGLPVVLDEFIFANVPGLDTTSAIDRDETIPAEKYIVHRQNVSMTGRVNENAVVYSVTIGASVGDFEFNWIGLVNKASNTLAMIVHAPVQQKIKNAAGQQGNVLTRSFLMEYNGAATEAEISTPAETWQIDFTARLSGIDERQRIENADVYGDGAFFGDGFLVIRNGGEYSITPGVGYVAGLRVILNDATRLAVTSKPVRIWVVAGWRGTVAGVWDVDVGIKIAADMAEYTENGRRYFVFAVASIGANGVITDLRPRGTLNEQAASDALIRHEKSRNHPAASLTEKGFVSLSNATDSDSETEAATPRAVKNTATAAAAGIAAANEAAAAARAGSYPLTGGQLNGQAYSYHVDNWRIICNNRGQFWRFDGNTLYLMFTNNGDPLGGWNELRPLAVNYENGDLTTNHNFYAAQSLKSGQQIVAAASVFAGNGRSQFAPDGNVYGEMWGGWLNNWLNANIAAAQQNAINWAYGNCVQDIRLGSSSEFQERGNSERMGGGVMTSFADRGSSNYWIRLRPLQKRVGDGWYTVGYQ